MSGEYDDIIFMPHHVSEKRKHMSMHDRAAQFSPFAALTGYNVMLDETARPTDKRTELDEQKKSEISFCLQMIEERIDDNIPVMISYFVPDSKKPGGQYISVTGTIKKIDRITKKIKMFDGVIIPVEMIDSVESDAFTTIPIDT